MTISYFSIATGSNHEPMSLLTKHFDTAKIRIYSDTVQLIAYFFGNFSSIIRQRCFLRMTKKAYKKDSPVLKRMDESIHILQKTTLIKACYFFLTGGSGK